MITRPQDHKTTRPPYSLILAGLALVAALATCHGPTTGAGSSPTTDTGPRWKQATAQAAFEATLYHTSLVFAPSGQTESRLWVIGGIFTDQDAIWSSADGSSWSQATKITDSTKRFSARQSHTSLVFKDKMWVIGGANKRFITSYNDVWSSGDGNDWTEAKITDSTKRFSARYSHSSLVFGGNMWVIGGKDISGVKNDVWYSIDGTDWTEATNGVSNDKRFTARSGHSSLVFKDPADNTDKMWVLGGYADAHKNDVWSSADGKAWSQASAAKWSARKYHSSLVFKDPADGLSKMWVMGGGDPQTNDVWWSVDGQSWTQARSADWSARYSHSSVVFKDKMWVIGGSYNNVWYYPDSPAIVPVGNPAAGSNPAAIANPAAANPASPVSP